MPDNIMRITAPAGFGKTQVMKAVAQAILHSGKSALELSGEVSDAALAQRIQNIQPDYLFIDEASPRFAERVAESYPELRLVVAETTASPSGAEHYERCAAEVACDEVLDEVGRVGAMWPPFNSAHEGLAVLLEEVDELKQHVWTNQKRRDLDAMRAEAIQVAAVAVRFAVQLCDEKTGRK